MTTRIQWIFSIAVVLTTPGCGASEIGEECETLGSQDECVDGAICSGEGDVKRCRQMCCAETDCIPCPAGHSCERVGDRPERSCQPD